MASISVQVDVNLDDIDTDDLVGQLCKRMEADAKLLKSEFSEGQTTRLRNAYSELTKMLHIKPVETPQINTLEDRMKYEHLMLVWKKYSSAQFESRLPA
jgi:hypothetical protein